MDVSVEKAIEEVRAISRDEMEEIFYMSDAAALILHRWVIKYLSLPRIYFPNMVCDAICEGLENGTLSVGVWNELRAELKLRPLERRNRDDL